MDKRSTFTVMFIDTCDGRSSLFSVIDVDADAEASQIKYPSPHKHEGFIFSGWSMTAQEVHDTVKAGQMIEVQALYKEAFVVKFIDGYDGSLFAVQTVAKDADAVAPAEYPHHGKYVGICWDKDLTSVQSSFETHVIYIDISSFARKSIAHKVVNNLRDIAAIQNSLKNIFTWIPGERILLPEFGSQLRKLLYEGITDYNVERIAAEIRRSISEWEPRVSVQDIVNVSTVNDTEDNTVHLQVLYTIPGLTDETFAYDINYSYGAA